jgi:hypothetical protein
MNVLILIAAISLIQAPLPLKPDATQSPGVIAQHKAIDYMGTEQQKQWLLAHLMVDLHFNDKKVTEWEKKLNSMTPTMIAVTAKAYVLQQEKKQLQDDRNYAVRMAKMQIQAQSYWYRSYYKYKYYNYTNYPCYGPSCGYPLRSIYVGRIYR